MAEIARLQSELREASLKMAKESETAKALEAVRLVTLLLISSKTDDVAEAIAERKFRCRA